MAGFTAVAAGIGLAVTAATTAASFAQAADQASKKQKAEEAAAKAMAEARKRLDVNVFEPLSIEKEAYEEARRSALVQGKIGTDILTEGDPRALAAGVGRIQLGQQQMQEKIALDQQQEQSQLDKLVAAEEGRLKDIGTSMNLMEVQGAQLAARDAEEAAAHALEQGIAGIGDMTGEFASMAKLYDDSDLTAAELREKYAQRDEKQGARLMQRDKRRAVGSEKRIDRRIKRKDQREDRQLKRLGYGYLDSYQDLYDDNLYENIYDPFDFNRVKDYRDYIS
jgi:hypothetical protein